MMEGSNGKKRPFGPHGEGCDCGQEESHGEKIPIEDGPEESPGARGMMMPSPHDSIFSATSDAFSSHFLNAIEACSVSGCPLDGRQIAFIMSALMQGFAQAKENARFIEYRYNQLIAMAVAQNMGRRDEETEEVLEEAGAAPGPAGPQLEVVPDPEPEEGHRLHDVSDLFTREPEAEEPEEPTETDG